jgi:hypothetical protein
MKKIVLTEPVEIALRMISDDDVRKVRGWFDRLSNWDSDSFVRRHSHSLPSVPDVQVLKTSTDLRIFFKMEGDTITVIDVARTHAILASAAVPEAE